MNALFSAPAGAGGYRWLYADVACGEWTAVAIFMLGAQFNYRYSVAAERGESAERHCAVNFALYRNGRRTAWLFSEYAGARADGDTLRVGGSSLRHRGDAVQVQIHERRAPFGAALEAELTLGVLGPGHDEVALVDGQPHYWQPLAPRAEARLRVPSLGLDARGDGYHDTNWGAEPLGHGLRGWDWSRTHSAEETSIRYQPWSGGRVIAMRANESKVSLKREPAARRDGATSAWGLRLPHDAPGSTLESSPFYARLEERAPAHHVLAEVADFGRFHRPWIRWMARFRSRAGDAA